MGILNNSLHVTLLPGEQNISVLIVGFICWTTHLASIPGLLPPYRILSRTNILMCVTFEPCAVVRRQKAWKIFISWCAAQTSSLRVGVRRCNYLFHATHECSTCRALANCETQDGNFSVWRHCAAHHVMRVFQAFSLLTIAHGSKVMHINFRKEGEGLGLRLHTPRCAI